MTQMRILARNLHDVATLTATSEAMPVAYTQRSERPMVWRSANITDQRIEATLFAAEYINCIALSRHNLGDDGLVRIELLNAGQVVHDSGATSTQVLIPAGIWRAGIDPWGATYNDQLPGGSHPGIYWLPEPVAADSYRLTLSRTAGESGDYFEIGRIFSGLSFSPSVNMSWGAKVEWQDGSEHIPTEGGSLRTMGAGHLRRRFDIQLDWLAESDRQSLIAQLQRAGLSTDLLVSLYPGRGGWLEFESTMVCRRVNTLMHTHNHLNNWQLPLSFLEL